MIVDNTHVSAGEGQSQVLNFFLPELNSESIRDISKRCVYTALSIRPLGWPSRLLLHCLMPVTRYTNCPKVSVYGIHFSLNSRCPGSECHDEENLDYSAIILFVSFHVSDILVLD